MNIVEDFKEFEIERLDLVIGGNAPAGGTLEATCRPTGNSPDDAD